jgi:hypothetical protein
VLRNFGHHEQLTGRGEDTRRNDPIIGQIVVKNYIDIGRGPHLAMITSCA